MNGLFTLWPCVNPSGANIVMDATGEYAGVVFMPIPGKTITKIAGRIISSTAGVVDVNLETLSSYAPSGSLVAANTQLAATSVSSSTNYEWTLAASYAVPSDASTMLAAVVRWNSGSAQIQYRMSEVAYLPRGYSSTGTPAGSNTLQCIGVGYSDGTWHPGIATLSANTPSGTTYNTGSTYDEYGNGFVCPFNVKVIGVRDTTRMVASSGLKYRIYDADLNVLTDDDDLTIDETDQHTSAVNTLTPKMDVLLRSPIYLSGGKTYYITRTATTANNIYYYPFTWSSQAIKDAFHSDPFQCYRDGGTGAFTTQTLVSEQIAPLCCCGFSSFARAG